MPTFLILYAAPSDPMIYALAAKLDVAIHFLNTHYHAIMPMHDSPYMYM